MSVYSPLTNRQRVWMSLGALTPADLELYRGVMDYFRDLPGWQVVPVGMDFEHQLTQHLRNGQVAGIIGEFVGGAWLDAALTAGVEAVHIRKSFALKGMPAVGLDYQQAGRVAAEYLQSLAIDSCIWYGRSRAVAALEIRAGMKDVLGDRLCNGGEVVAGAKAYAVYEKGELAPLIQGLQQAGARIPQDVAIIGFGESILETGLTGEEITSVRLPWREVGFQAGQLLQSRIVGEERTESVAVAVGEIAKGGSTPSQRRSLQVVERSQALMRERMSDVPGVADVARLLGVSRRSLELAFQAEGRPAPYQVYQQIRLDQAIQLMDTTRLALGDIASACGYASLYAFSAAFKRRIGCSPRAYRTEMPTLDALG